MRAQLEQLRAQLLKEKAESAAKEKKSREESDAREQKLREQLAAKDVELANEKLKNQTPTRALSHMPHLPTTTLFASHTFSVILSRSLSFTLYSVLSLFALPCNNMRPLT